MTAFREAFRKAGGDPAAAQLTALAADALKMHGTPAKAAPFFWRALKKRGDLCEALALYFLTRMAGEEKCGGAGQSALDTQCRNAGAAAKTVPVNEYKRRPPTAKQAARKVEMACAAAIADIYSSRKIDGRDIGDLTWKELGHLVLENAMLAASYLQRGTLETENALLLSKIASWATVSDPAARVRDVVKADQLAAFIEEARREAPMRIARGMRSHAAALTRPTLDLEDQHA